MNNTEIRAWLERAKTQPITAGLALEMMPMMENLLGRVEHNANLLEFSNNALAKAVVELTESDFALDAMTDAAGELQDAYNAAEAKLKAASELQRFRDEHTKEKIRFLKNRRGRWIKFHDLRTILKKQDND